MWSKSLCSLLVRQLLLSPYIKLSRKFSDLTGLRCIWFFATLLTIACQALSMGFSGKNTVVGCPFLLQGIFPTQGSNQRFLWPALTGGLFTTAPPGKPGYEMGGLEMWNHDTISTDNSCERGNATEVRYVVSWGANKPELQKVQNTNMHRKACEKGETWVDVQPPHRMLCGDWPTANWYSDKYCKRPTETVKLCLGQAGE